MPIPAPSAAPLPAALTRALRPLIARRPSPTRSVLDPVATANRYAVERVLEPVLTPVPTRVVNLSLVVDTGPSMDVWGPTIDQLRDLFGRLPAFGRVGLWHLSTADPEPALGRVVARPGGPSTVPARRPTDVAAPGGFNVTLVVTDGVSAAWHRPTLVRWLAEWGRAGRVAVVQLLPPNLWPRAALAGWSPGVLRSRGGRPEWESEYGDERPSVAPPIPVVGLSPEELRELALLVTGRGTVRVPAFIPVAPVEDPGGEAPSGADEAAARFARTASPNARRLAALLSASPFVNLQIVRLVAEACARPGERFLPEHHAEVWLGGLLEGVPGAAREADRDRVLYQFPPAVCRALQGWLTGYEIRDVLRQVAVYIEGNLGRMPGLVAALRDPSAGQAAAAGWCDEFSAGVRGLLRRLGGPYRGLAQAMPNPTPGAGTQIIDSASDAWEVGYTEEKLGLGPIDTSSERVRTIAARLPELHTSVQKWIDDNITTQKNDNLKANKPIIDLLFAFAFAKLGETTTARRLLGDTRKVMEGPLPRSDGSPQAEQKVTAAVVRNFMYKAFESRVDQALVGKPHTGQSAPEVLDTREEIAKKAWSGPVNNPYKLAKYVVDRMREQSRIMEPQDRPDVPAFRGENLLDKELSKLHTIYNPNMLADRILKLIRDGSDDRRLEEVRLLTLLDGLPLAARVNERFAVELLAYVPASLTADIKSPDLTLWQGQILERAFFLAGHFKLRHIVEELVSNFTALARSESEDARIKIANVVMRQCLQSLKKCGLTNEIDPLLAVLHSEVLRGASVAELRKKHSAQPDAYAAVLQTLLNLAGGWMHFGLIDRARPILEAARNELLGSNAMALKSKDYTELARAYVAALGQSPSPEQGLREMIELFRRMWPSKIDNRWTTAQYFSRFHFNLVEDTVLAVCRMASAAD